VRVLGIDASLRSTGYGIVESRSGRLAAGERGIVRNAGSLAHSACLLRIRREIVAVLARARPDVAALEGGFHFRNARTALVLGEVRGVVIAACAEAGVAVYEYAPRHIKQSLTGFGAADKSQVSKMAMSVLGLDEKPPEDAADALATAICHHQSHSGIAALRPKPI